MLKEFSVVVITCPSLSSVIFTEKEIQHLKKKGRLSADLCILAIEDPTKNVGSGAATLNALLVATEHLSVKQNLMVISSDVLNEARILILHNGRNCLYSCTGNAFIPLPLDHAQISSSHTGGIVTNLESIIFLVDEISRNCPCGIWICSTDMMILRGQESIVIDWGNIADAAMFCIPSNVKYATGHGVVAVDKEGYVSDILYCADESQIIDHVQSDGKVPLVSGIVYLTVNVAESLLTLHAQAPLDSCTYLGLDSGVDPIQVSLYFDILVAMSSKIKKETFIAGKCGKIYNHKVGISQDSSEARSFFWNELSKYRMTPKILSGCQHLYWSDCGRDYMDNLFQIAKTKKVHTLVETTECAISPQSLIVNSKLKVCRLCEIAPHSIVYDSEFEVRSLSMGDNSFVSGVVLKSYTDISIPSNVFVIRTSVEGCKSHLMLMFGCNENLVKTVDIHSDTFCNIPLKQHFEALDITENDLWPADINPKQRTLMNARLFVPDLSLQGTLLLFHRINPKFEGSPPCDNPFGGDTNDPFEWMAQPSQCGLDLISSEKYKNSKRYSLSDVMEAIDFSKVLDFRRLLYGKISTGIIKKVLLANDDLPLLPYFKAASFEDWLCLVIRAIDSVLLSDETNTVIKSRALSSMADLLGAMAGPYGGLRSGPGSNPAWSFGFLLLMNGNIIPGLKILMSKRTEWMNRPAHLMRAARHYERAVQILIQISVKSALQFLNVRTAPLPEMSSNVIVECPARIDIQGGWSDTPPICYELGGSVVNIAVLVDDLKPIGASACRTTEPSITLNVKCKEISYEIKITHLKDLLDYNQPSARGALLKAVIVCADIIEFNVDYENLLPLDEQLLSKYGGGFMLKTWSLLPHGCGMGTSSIIAGAAVAALWTAAGKTFDKLSVVHAVLYAEQLLTTGGGWQDQVAGILGGINRGYSEANLPLKVQAEPITLSPEIIKKLNGHFLLINTGKVRLAKSLLQHVIRNWYAREEIVVNCFKDLVIYSHQMKDALEKGDLTKIGALMDKYWEQKKILAPGCEPLIVKILMEQLKPICYGQLLVGAGGGGFMCILTKDFKAKSAVQDILASLMEQFKEFKAYEKMSIHSVTIDFSGLQITTS